MGWVANAVGVLVILIILILLFSIFRWWTFIIPIGLLLIYFLIRLCAIIFWYGRDRGQF